MAELVSQQGRLSVNELADAYGITTETVRRDLSMLERAGIIRRVHGGAVPAEALTRLETAVGDRDRAHADQKDRIARAALDLLPASGGSVLLDAGTTTSRLASHLPLDLKLTVVTNAVPIAARLAGLSNVDLHLLPGRVRRTTQAAVGEDTVAALGVLRTDVVFLGTNGLDADHGLTTPDYSEAAAKRAMVRAGRRVVVLADSSKIGEDHTVRFADLADVDVLVTDAGVDDVTVKALEDLGVEVVVA
ncbi:MAG TPA: DeoR/GlpR family DNA-binding transcription regulator [Nocardioidaceae bacterium]|nr:DeoR/GlpR family DNA-binding transcription regulator [Nocardioidaceae bacterium]